MNEQTKELLNKYKQKIFNNSHEYTREIFNELEQVIENHNVILIGLRQVGKTTLMEQLAQSYYNKKIKEQFSKELISVISSGEDIFYINLKTLYKINSEQLINNISRHKYKLILIDEIQLIPNWSNFVQATIDLNPQARFIISGSNSRALKKETMVNRVKIFYIHPLSFIEFKNIWKTDDISTYLKYGSYPRLMQYQDPIIQYREILESNIIDKIIINDISTDVNISKFKTLMKDIRNYVGNELIVSKLENKQITRQTAKNYIRLMQDAQLIHLLPKYKDKNSKINTKIYFEDKSMLYFFNDFTDLDDDSFGLLIENTIFSYLIKKYANQLKISNIFYYQGHNKKEINFLVASAKVLIQCKFGSDINIEKLVKDLNETINHHFADYRKIVITKNINTIVDNWEFISLESILRDKNSF